MSLSTTQYGYIIDPMVPFTGPDGQTVKNGYVRVFLAGSSTPVITYANFDGTANQERIELDNSGRTAYPVIVSKGNTYKVCVYDAEHSQESPILTIDKVVPAGANVEATNIVMGLDNVESPEAGWVKSTVSGTDAEVSLDATNVTSEVDTMVKATAASADYMIPLVHKTGSDPDKKIMLGNIFKFVLDNIVNLATTITSFASGDYFVVGRSTGAAKMSKDDLRKNVLKSSIGDITDLNDLNDTGYYRVESTMAHYPSGAGNGLLVVFSAGESRKIQILESSVTGSSARSRVWYRVGEFAHNTWGTWEEVADVASVQSMVSALDTKVFSLITYPSRSLSFGELPDVQTLLNTNIEPETSVARLAVYNLGTYNTYYFYAQSDVEVYFDDDVIADANYLSVAYGTSPSGTWVPVPDSSTNRRYMQCSAVARKRKSNNDLPTSNAKLTIPAGSIIAFTQRNTDSAKVNINCYPQLSPSLSASEPKKMKIKYTSSSSYQISFGDYECELYRVVNEAADADNWNVVHISRNGFDIIGRWTDIIGPLKISGDDDFIGGVHGSETTNNLYVYSGSKKLTLNADLDEEFEKLTIMMNSTCRRESNQADAFSRRVCVEITRNKMHISSEYECISSSSLIVTRVSNGGLISANNNVILGCYMDNYNCDGYPLSAPNNKSKYNTHAVIVTTLGTIVVDNIKGHEQEDYKGWFNLFDQEVVPRTKIYFEPYNGAGKTITNGYKFYGECEYMFEP